ncbi:MAG: site-specific integrase [Gammaproteobacteria bacterium]|mgnify:FL=1|jgi:integrase|nr:site-specific integrase [Gammaproteobacteria bacterium]MBT3893576.1 site-specific integrase [Gammaproteobacteria bacterium]MBT4548473.1 site-specific integrase [Gammaproteobacteria bacterium]MBT5370568.1 site-specific integrase [Gammaproteobacteria bacterium]MBT6479047.1 site-specific integrase [Gammaproteobacteria bacterium]
MATFRKRGKNWAAEINLKGVRKSKTFRTKQAAKNWVSDEERLILDGAGLLPDKPFVELLYRYNKEVKSGTKYQKWEYDRIAFLEEHYELGKVSCREVNETHIAQWRDERLQTVSADTVRREWGIFSSACRHAIREWKWLRDNPFSKAKRPQALPERDRRITDEEIGAIVYASGYDANTPPETNTERVGAAFLFAIETAVRSGEMLQIKRENVFEDYVHLPKEITKSNRARDIPLTDVAKNILDNMMELGFDPVFGINSANRDALFRRIRDRALVTDLHFHDTRREALSRLSEIYDVMELAKISGHRDIRILQNVYYAPKPMDLVQKLKNSGLRN